jgi:hypothetical protein
MSSGDMGAIKVAVKGLRAQYMADPENKPEPTLIGGDRPRSDGSVFQSSEEVVAAVRDPRYKTDKAYRDAYEKKLARSDVFGQGRGKRSNGFRLSLERPRSLTSRSLLTFPGAPRTVRGSAEGDFGAA